MWDFLSNDIKRLIISFNPSFKEIHKTKLQPSINAINFTRYEKMCVECVRGSIFGINGIQRKPSVKMYVMIEERYSNSSEILTARVTCSCKEHMEISPRRHLIKNGMEMDYIEIFQYIKKNFCGNISSVIKHSGIDENQLEFLLSISRGENDYYTSEFAISRRWERILV